MKKTNEAFYLLEELSRHLTSSSDAYKKYLENGKTYFYASELKRYNDMIREILTGKIHLLSTTLQQDVLALLAHYNAWTEKWNALQLELQPSPTDEFVFENEHRFPRAAAQHLEQEYLRLKELNEKEQ